MTRRITLDLDAEVANLAEQLAAQQGASVTELLTRILTTISSGGRQPEDLPPLTRKLSGMAQLPPGRTAEDIVGEALREKHGTR